MIHIVNGDEFGERLRECPGLNGEVFVWRELYDLGPFSPDWDEQEMAARRALFLEETLGIPVDRMEMVLRYQEQRLNRLPLDARVVFWCAPHRHDQMMLTYLLSRLSDRGLQRAEWVELPGVQPPSGLTDPDLVQRFENRRPLGQRHLEQAVSAWRSYISPDPRDIEDWLKTTPSSLPDLRTVFRRHLEYFPSTSNGLNVVEELILQKIREQPLEFRELFREISLLRQEDGLSEVHLAVILNELGGISPPLIRFEGESVMILTPLGEQVLTGEQNRLRVCGIDRWLGGVHLREDSCWCRTAGGMLVRRE